MNTRTPLIVGIDPGTTLGYAVLDFNGNTITIHSSRVLSFDQLLSKITEIGKPIIIATDKRIIPNSIENFARKTGARIINPNYDLKVNEKKSLTSGYNYEDIHQMDSLASALYAFKSIYHIIKKIESSLETNKEILKGYVIEDVLLKGKSVNNTIYELIRKEQKVKVVEKRVIMPLKSQNLIDVSQKIHKLEEENMFLRKTRAHLEMKIDNLTDDIKALKEINERIEYGSKNKRLLKFKEIREFQFLKEIRFKNEQIKTMQNDILKLNYMINNIKDKVVIKKLKNFGTIEFQRVNHILSISPGDLVMVEDPRIVSQNIVDFIAKNNIIIVTDKKISQNLPFVTLSKIKIRMIESRYFAIANKRDIEKEINVKTVLNKIIEQYQSTRF